MTIVLQHQYWDLEVDDEGFGGDAQLQRPDAAPAHPVQRDQGVRRPGVEFGLQFTLEEDGEPPAGEPVRLLGGGGRQSQEEGEAESAATEPSGGAEIVALDRFRKK